jgi:hypothetical protein
MTSVPVEAVVAKAGTVERLAVEENVYTELLPALRVAFPPYYGLVENGDGLCWLFVGEASGDPFRPDRNEHRALASRWLALLHTLGTGVPAEEHLPLQGADHWLVSLREARQALEETRRCRALEPVEEALLDRLVGQCDRLVERWSEIERVCAARLRHYSARLEDAMEAAGLAE